MEDRGHSYKTVRPGVEVCRICGCERIPSEDRRSPYLYRGKYDVSWSKKEPACYKVERVKATRG